jgi:Arc/MetJ family transcription regulator
MRLSVTVDPKLLEEAKNLAGLRTKREVIEVALREMILHRRLQDLAKLEGSGLIETDLEQLIQWREAGIES